MAIAPGTFPGLGRGEGLFGQGRSKVTMQSPSNARGRPGWMISLADRFASQAGLLAQSVFDPGPVLFPTLGR
jgi:hypothetical protein